MTRLDRHSPQTVDTLAAQFERFRSKWCTGNSALYEALCDHILANPQHIASCLVIRPGQSAPNLYFAAVQFLLLTEAPQHPLANYYPSLVGLQARSVDDGLLDAFDNFCDQHANAIAELMTGRFVQSSEPRRSALITPAMAQLRRWGLESVHLVDVGTACGFNMFWDHWQIQPVPGDIRTLSRTPGSLLLQVLGCPPSALPLAPVPDVLSRVGTDIAPIDYTDDSCITWLRALIFADQVDRFSLFDEALALVRREAPTLLPGDARLVLPHLLSALPSGEDVCVLFSFVVNQAFPEGRVEAQRILREASEGRRVAEVTLADQGGEHAELLVSVHQDRELVCGARLAFVDAHGKWISWEG